MLELRELLGDLLADLHHLSDHVGLDWGALITTAELHHAEETKALPHQPHASAGDRTREAADMTPTRWRAHPTREGITYEIPEAGHLQATCNGTPSRITFTFGEDSGGIHLPGAHLAGRLTLAEADARNALNGLGDPAHLIHHPSTPGARSAGRLIATLAIDATTRARGPALHPAT